MIRNNPDLHIHMSLSVANIEYPITNIPPIHFICDYEYFTEANHCIKSVSIL